MQRTFFVLILAANLLARSGLLTRLWGMIPGAPASTVLEKEGPGWDPNGATAPAPSEAGPGWDPSGRS